MAPFAGVAGVMSDQSLMSLLAHHRRVLFAAHAVWLA
jgi:hypothetical protein